MKRTGMLGIALILFVCMFILPPFAVCAGDAADSVNTDYKFLILKDVNVIHKNGTYSPDIKKDRDGLIKSMSVVYNETRTKCVVILEYLPENDGKLKAKAWIKNRPKLDDSKIDSETQYKGLKDIYQYRKNKRYRMSSPTVSK